MNLVVHSVLHRADRHSINIKGVVAHVLTDAYAFAATIIAGIIVMTTGWQRADPVASLFVVVLLLRAARGLLVESGRVLLEAAPSEVDLELVRSHLMDAPYVVDLHDLHVWTVTSGLPALSVHVVITDDCFTTGRAPQLARRAAGLPGRALRRRALDVPARARRPQRARGRHPPLAGCVLEPSLVPTISTWRHHALQPAHQRAVRN